MHHLDLSPVADVSGGVSALRPRSGRSRHASQPVRPLVAESWARSARSGASRDGSRLPDIRLPSDELRGYRAEHPLAPLLPVFRDLLGRTAQDEDCIFAVADADGTLLWVEGRPSVLTRAERMNFVEGAVWTEARVGTNAPGTALAVGQPVQIIGSEHYSSVVQPWSCSAVPIRGTDGRLLGVIDVTGDEKAASPSALALIRAAARAGEAELARRSAEADSQALRTCLEQLGGPAALLTKSGRVLYSTGVAPADLAQFAPTSAGPLLLPDSRLLVAEQIGDGGHLLVRFDGPHRSSPKRSPIRLTALGRDSARLEVDGCTHRLSHRHSEIIVALTLMTGGVSAGRLAVELSEDEIPLVNIRVEMSRLRALLGPEVLGSRPYELRRPVRSDFADLRDLLAAGRVDDAVATYAGPLLPWSDAPVIAEFREVLEQQLRGEVLAAHDPALLRRWVDAPWGSTDAEAWRTLADNLPGGSLQRAAAAGRARALLAPILTPTRRDTLLLPRHQ